MKKRGLTVLLMMVLFSFVFANVVFAEAGEREEDVLRNALSNLSDEFSERISTTPLQIFNMLADSLENGATTINFSYHDEWTDRNDNVRVYSEGINFTVYADSENTEYRINYENSDSSESIDFIIYSDSDRIAVSSSLINGDTYGMDIRTFQQDLERFGMEFGLDEFEIAEIAAFFDEYIGMLSPPEAVSGDGYTEAFIDFLLPRMQISENVDGYASITLDFMGDELIGLLNDLLDIYENNNRSNAMAHTVMAGLYRIIIEELEYDIGGVDFSVAFYIGADGRLSQMDISGVNTHSYGTSVTEIKFNFGNSANDAWSMSITANMNWGIDSFDYTWEIREADGRFVHTVEYNQNIEEYLTSCSGIPYNYVYSETLTSDWNPLNGEYLFTVTEPDGRYEATLSGIYNVYDDGTFRFSFETVSDYYNGIEKWTFEIYTDNEVNIGDWDFINFGDITMEIIEQTEIYQSTQRNARMAANRAAAVTMAQTFNNFNAVGGQPEITVIPESNNGVWSATIPSHIPNGGDPLMFSISFSSSERFDQVGGWITYQTHPNSSIGFWVVSADVDFDVRAE